MLLIAAKECMHIYLELKAMGYRTNKYFKIEIGVLVSASIIDNPNMFHVD